MEVKITLALILFDHPLRDGEVDMIYKNYAGHLCSIFIQSLNDCTKNK